MVFKHQNQAEMEIKSYMNKKRIGVSDDPLSFWKVCRNDIPALAKLARLYLSPSISSDSEGEFRRTRWNFC